MEAFYSICLSRPPLQWSNERSEPCSFHEEEKKTGGGLLHADFHKLDKQGIAFLLQANTDLLEAKCLHSLVIARMLDSDLFISNHLVNMYSKCSAVPDARSVFDRMQERNLVSWNAMITAYSRNGYVREALDLFWAMQKEAFEPNKVTYLSLLRVFTAPEDLEQAKLIHSVISRSRFRWDVAVGNAILSMYGRCGAVHDAADMFNNMIRRDVVSWTAMISVYSDHGHSGSAVNLYKEMQQCGIKPDMVAFLGIIGAYANMTSLAEGKAIHAHIAGCGLEAEVYIRNALINLYGRCGDVDSAYWLFYRTEERTVMTWNAMITAYSQQEYSKESLNLFLLMLEEGFMPTYITFTSLLSACASPTALEEGKYIHSYVIEYKFESDIAVESSLVSMYGKCGALAEACFVFAEIFEPNLYAWNAIIVACSQHGDAESAFHFFQEMEQHVRPNEVTFIGLLSACSHRGMLSEGYFWLISMAEKHALFPSLEHYSCMIDLLGRAGQLGEAEQLIDSMPLEPDVQVWTSLLRACKLHGDVRLAEIAAKHLFELDPKNTAALVLLANVYALEGRWDILQKFETMLLTGDKMVQDMLWDDD